jgi:HEAT repeat protein
METTSIDELFASTLSGDYDDDAPWEAVHALRKLGTREVFDKAAAWCESDEPLVRTRGIDVLAQLGKSFDHPAHGFPKEAYSIVSALVQREEDIRPLDSAIVALGHLDITSAIPLIARLHAHPSPEIRESVAFSLGSFPDDELSIEAFLLLMEDPDEDVRDWATFGLGTQSDRDSSVIRDALFHRLGDTNEDVRAEAMVGLGKRKDVRVLPSLFAELQGPEIKVLVAEAASWLLGMDEDPEDWGADEYREALESHFRDELAR